MRIAAIIPARMASSRFPGKALVSVRGLPMVEHVRRRALLCKGFSEVVVATCDMEIAAAVQRFGGKVVMTSPHHPAATDRVAEAAERLDCTHVVNVQGDEILVLPSDLEAMVQAMRARPDQPAWNAIAPVEREGELLDPSIVKCLVSRSDRILSCTRRLTGVASSLLGAGSPICKLLGVLGYRRDFLERYRALDRTPLEIAESVDQSRVVEHDVPLQGIRFREGYLGVNHPHELEEIETVLQRDPSQQPVWEEMLSR